MAKQNYAKKVAVLKPLKVGTVVRITDNCKLKRLGFIDMVDSGDPDLSDPDYPYHIRVFLKHTAKDIKTINTKNSTTAWYERYRFEVMKGIKPVPALHVRVDTEDVILNLAEQTSKQNTFAVGCTDVSIRAAIEIGNWLSKHNAIGKAYAATLKRKK